MSSDLPISACHRVSPRETPTLSPKTSVRLKDFTSQETNVCTTGREQERLRVFLARVRALIK